MKKPKTKSDGFWAPASQIMKVSSHLDS